MSQALVKQGHDVTALVGPPYPNPMPQVREIRLPNKHLWGVKVKDLLLLHDLKSLFTPLNFFEYVASRTGYCPEPLAFSIRAALKFKELHQDRPFDVLHDVETLGFGLLLARTLGTPTVSTVHHTLRRDLAAFLPRATSWRERYHNTVFYPLLMQGLVARRIDGMITSSQVGLKELNEAFRVKTNKIHLVYTGVNAATFSPDPSLERDPKEILFVGNAEDPRKGIRYLLEAMSDLPSGVILTVVDQGEPDKHYAPGLVRSMGLEDRVTFTGRLTEAELVERYRRTQVLVMPSLFEGFGLPVAEAMACGTPVVTTRSGSLPEVVGDDQEGGLLVPPKNPHALSEAINKLISQPNFSRELGLRARRRVERLFSWDRTAENTVQIYQQLINQHTSRQAAPFPKGKSQCITTKTN
ncbi:MAG: glycosyltransferase family 4 protein [Deltaproteobacteria bacterium]|nr:glycosyltransferase family 4 protein [Deltaproteobacteria bacterium]MBW2050627.1 glycosyltransferase family 4 protein [Deltaproteobacteria bacterium]MBW2139479.1 glycosyltransferase family 4 protein [Deltaproteobacteria bacterium]MBW2322228.1 glycosyltransferase family 4 protein [Deltaproteobacteria bacterium]